MEVKKIEYEIELNEREAKILYEAEGLLSDMLKALPSRDLGIKYNNTRHKIDVALAGLVEVGSMYNISTKLEKKEEVF